jgi:type I restriction enzyme, S subunit
VREGWRTHRLGDLCEIVKGRKPQLKAQASEGDLPYLVAKVMRGNQEPEFAALSDRNSVFVSEDDTIIICDGSNSGEVFTGFRGILSSTMGKLVKKGDIDDAYLRAFLDSTFEVFNGAKTGAAIPHLDKEALYALPFSYPALSEQRRIVAILDEAFEGIATAKANAEKNLLNARELFGRLSAAVMDQLAPISRITTLEEVAEPGCSLSYGIVQPGDEVASGLPIVRPVDLNDGVVTLDGLKRINPALAKSYERTTLKGNDILLCVRGTTGALAMADSELAGANVTRGIVPIRFDEAQISQDFGYCLMRSEPVQMQIQAKTYGTALMQINIRDLRQLTLPVPPKQAQEVAVKRFDELKAATDQLVETYQRKLSVLYELKKSLLHQAFTGQL